MVRSMTSGNPISLILAFTVPLLIGNVFQQFYNIADIIIVGRTIGVNALAAVAPSPLSICPFLAWTIGLSAGFSVIVGQRFGAKRHGRPAPFRGDVDDIGLCHYPFGYGRRQPFYAPHPEGHEYIRYPLRRCYHYMIIIVLGLVA